MPMMRTKPLYLLHGSFFKILESRLTLSNKTSGIVLPDGELSYLMPYCVDTLIPKFELVVKETTP